MLQVELKKILFHHKGLLLLLIALAAYAVFCVGSGYDSSYVIDRNEDTYLTYMERWQGGRYLPDLHGTLARRDHRGKGAGDGGGVRRSHPIR